MNTQHHFVAERAAAQHCAELVRTGPAPVDLIPALDRAADRIARQLAPALSGLLGGEAPSITAAPADQIGMEALSDEIGGLAANSLLGNTGSGLTLLASVEGAAMLRLVDRAFGGRGETSGPLPDQFPLSAEMMVRRLDEILTQCLGAAFGLADLASLRRESRLAELEPFPPATRLVALRLEVADGAGAAWKLLVVVPLAQLPRLLGTMTSEGAAPRRTGTGDPHAPPFASLPLPITATLVDMRVPLSTLAALEPGTVLPVAVARAVPLSIGESILARGTIGSADDRVAVKLTHIA